jgi:hypothetical protein
MAGYLNAGRKGTAYPQDSSTEKWDVIPVDKPDTRTTLVAAANAYLDCCVQHAASMAVGRLTVGTSGRPQSQWRLPRAILNRPTVARSCCYGPCQAKGLLASVALRALVK